VADADDEAESRLPPEHSGFACEVFALYPGQKVGASDSFDKPHTR